jgi:hypothetical protein
MNSGRWIVVIRVVLSWVAEGEVAVETEVGVAGPLAAVVLVVGVGVSV